MSRMRLRVQHNGRLVSLRGIDVESIEPFAIVSRVPGSPFGMALVRGQIVPVFRLGDANGCLVVGRVGEEILGVVGLDVVDFTLDDSEVEDSSPGLAYGMRRIEIWEPSRAEGDDNHLELDIEAIIETAKLDKLGSALPVKDIQ